MSLVYMINDHTGILLCTEQYPYAINMNALTQVVNHCTL